MGVEGQGPGAIGSFIALTQTIAKAFGWGDTGSPIEDVEIFNEPAGTGSGLGGPEPDRCRTRRSRAGEALADLHEASGPDLKKDVKTNVQQKANGTNDDTGHTETALARG